jgi:hypothetical protein
MWVYKGRMVSRLVEKTMINGRFRVHCPSDYDSLATAGAAEEQRRKVCGRSGHFINRTFARGHQHVTEAGSTKGAS